jgi:hypothetical protein
VTESVVCGLMLVVVDCMRIVGWLVGGCVCVWVCVGVDALGEAGEGESVVCGLM